MTKQLICIRCNSIGASTTKTKGSFFIELLLWLCFIIPGIIYSIWRLTTKYKACRFCGSADLVPEDSPRGKFMVSEVGITKPEKKGVFD